MRTGRLRCNAVLQSATASQDAIGGTSLSWGTFLASWWCELHQAKGGEAFRGRVVHAEADHVATGRWVSGVTPRHRMTFNGRTFDIKAADDLDNRNRTLVLHLKERGL